jgi:hypothetical protein
MLSVDELFASNSNSHRVYSIPNFNLKGCGSLNLIINEVDHSL